MTSGTDELRRLLDERGVEYDIDDEDGCEFTEWVANGLEWEADSRGELVSLMPVMLITPEQAIAATLGSCNCSDNCTNSERTETCHMEQTGHVKMAGVDYYDDDYECSECGAEIFEGYNFCPMCGRRIEQ